MTLDTLDTFESLPEKDSTATTKIAISQQCERILTPNPQKMRPKPNFRLPNIKSKRTLELCQLFKRYHVLYTDLVHLYNITWDTFPPREKHRLPNIAKDRESMYENTLFNIQYALSGVYNQGHHYTMITHDMYQEMLRMYSDLETLTLLMDTDPDFLAEVQTRKQQLQKDMQELEEKIERNGYKSDKFYHRKEYQSRHIY